MVTEEAAASEAGEAGWVGSGGGEGTTGKWGHTSWMAGWRDHPAEPAAGCLPQSQLATHTYHCTQVSDEARLENVLPKPPGSLASGLLSPQLA